MRLDNLRHRAVVDPDSACRTGIVTDYLVDATAGRVALLVRPMDADLQQRVLAPPRSMRGQARGHACALD